jgi:photoactive yellow protein
MFMLDDLDDSALDDLPFGVVCLSESGRVVRMNRTESERSGIQRWRAIGRDFFAEVGPAIARTFQRRRGEDPTRIELVPGRGTGRVYLCIHRE